MPKEPQDNVVRKAHSSRRRSYEQPEFLSYGFAFSPKGYDDRSLGIPAGLLSPNVGNQANPTRRRDPSGPESLSQNVNSETSRGVLDVCGSQLDREYLDGWLTQLGLSEVFAKSQGPW